MGSSLCVKSTKIPGKRLPQNHSSSADSPTPSPAVFPCVNSSVRRTDSLGHQKNMLFLQGNLKPRGQIISWYKLLYRLCWSPGDLFQHPALHWVYSDPKNTAWCMHPPSCLPSNMSQKPHKTWVFQTPPPWASHGQEIGHSFPPGSWPSRSCMSLLKSHKMKIFSWSNPRPCLGRKRQSPLGGAACLWDAGTPEISSWKWHGHPNHLCLKELVRWGQR